MPRCSYCKWLTLIWDKSREEYKDYKTNVITKRDFTAKKFKDLRVQQFPTIKLIQRKENEMPKEE